METPKQAGRHQIQPYPLRLPPELAAHLKAMAAVNRRSLHGELILRLENSMKAEETLAQGAAQ